MVWAFGPAGSNSLSYHGSSSSGTAGAASVAWQSGAASVVSGGLKVNSVIAHGAAMTLAWGLFVPAGVGAARFLKGGGSSTWFNWFKFHRAVQSLDLRFARL